MFMQRLLCLCVFLMALFTLPPCLAGGPEHTPQPRYAGVYIEGNGGYAYRNWRDNGLLQNYIVAFQGGAVFGPFNNGRDGATGGAALGYQVNQFIAVEGGWSYLPHMRYVVPMGNMLLFGNAMSVNSCLAYVGVKLNVPVYAQTYLFGKFGAAYVTNHGSFSGGTAAAIATAGLPTNGTFWAPLFAGGIQYYFSEHWSVNFQYLYVRGYRKVPLGATATHFPSPDTNLFTVGIGFKFV